MAEPQDDQHQKNVVDVELVPIDDQVKIGISNFRIALEKTQPDPIYKVYLLRNALRIISKDLDHPFTLHAPENEIISFINELGKATMYDRPSLLMLQSLWGIVTGNNVDFAELIWEDFKYQIESSVWNAIPIVMMNEDIKASAEYSKYLAKSKGSKYVKGKGLLSKEGVEVVVERVSIPKRRRSKTIVEEVGQSEEIADEVDFEETQDDEDEPLVRRRPTGVVIGGESHRESEEESLDHSKKLKGTEMLSTAAQFKLDLKKARKASKYDFILQHRLIGLGEGSGVALEGLDGLSQKGPNEGSGVTLAVPDEPKDSSSSSSLASENEVEDISSDDEIKGADDNKKADESKKADAENVEVGKVDKADEKKTEEEHVRDKGGNERAGDAQAEVHVSEPKLRSLSNKIQFQSDSIIC
ncbi:hypothetical protein Tco_0821153 [Tanacetum coccineum]|uniref:Uncharacterized protein n=1 Tax=Tanacetum coccineum TaxID=301880 RepID=A0ABQ5AFR8_9ASTR